ncbi:hypothetical protein E4191_07560 [Paracoccus liaowanqingii]|uniref:Uncharacterized protein n=1 Tax=Paracoccus liaowanqingii TaxID=2560053 RepID=A0A4V1BJ02_9RHOB|nr:hypothetical protein [Paracoccus liaowanqingii]QBX34582.1 hypothetical protein E4191_07560 [Paracoccus liaowanqingii]
MRISFSPVRMDKLLQVEVSGDVLTVNGIDYDFSPLQEGDVMPAETVGCEWLVSDVTRMEGHVSLTLILPHGTGASEAARFPQPIIATDGPVPLPGIPAA